MNQFNKGTNFITTFYHIPLREVQPKTNKNFSLINHLMSVTKNNTKKTKSESHKQLLQTLTKFNKLSGNPNKISKVYTSFQSMGCPFSNKFLKVLSTKKQQQSPIGINQNKEEKQKQKRSIDKCNKSNLQLLKIENRNFYDKIKQASQQQMKIKSQNQLDEFKNIKGQNCFQFSLIQSTPQMAKLKRQQCQSIFRNTSCLHSTIRKTLIEKGYKSHNFITKHVHKINIKTSLNNRISTQQKDQQQTMHQLKKSADLMNQIMKDNQRQVRQNIKKQCIQQKGKMLKSIISNTYETNIKKGKKQKFYKLRKIKNFNEEIKKYKTEQQEQLKLTQNLSLDAQQSEAKRVIEQYSQQFVRSDFDKTNKSTLQCLKIGHNSQLKRLKQLQNSQLNAWQIVSTTRYQKFY